MLAFKNLKNLDNILLALYLMANSIKFITLYVYTKGLCSDLYLSRFYKETRIVWYWGALV